MKSVFILLFFCFSVNALFAGEFNILNYGAVSDTSVLSTKAIQSAIDQCSILGGKVIIPAGNYSSGTIYLKSNVSIYLEKGATLYGSKHLKDYPENQPDYIFYRKGSVKRALIYAENCSNIAIEGDGTINGQGECFWIPDGVKVDSYSVRPYTIWMIQCKNIRTEGIKLRNSALWMQHYLACDNLYVHNIDVYNHCNKNNDMIDIDGCHDVRISDCVGDTDDDGITLKSTSGRANENIVVTNCLLSSHCNAIKMGTESNTGFKNIAISNIVVRPSKKTDSSIGGIPNGHTGIALETVDGGDIDGVVISNIRIDGVECPIFIRLGNRARAYYAGQKIEKPGVLQNVSISNVIATNAKKTGCSITGIPGYPVENISLSHISIEFEGGGAKADFQRDIPEMEKAYPEYDMFDVLPSFGFFIRHGENVKFSDIQLTTKNEDLRPAICLNEVKNSVFNSVYVSGSSSNYCAISLEKSKDIRISEGRIQGTTNALLNLKGSENSKIILLNSTLTNVKAIYTPESKPKDIVVEIGNIR